MNAVEKSVLLACPPAEAFRLFTARINAWWPPDRRHTQDPQSELFLLDPRDGGRFYERDRQGREVDLGRVLSWQPPARLVFTFFPGTDADHPTEVEVRFSPEGEGTRVNIVHRPTEASADLFGTRAPRYERSWQLVLAALAAAALGNR